MLMLCKFPDLESEICDHHLIFELLITINGIYLYGYGIRYDTENSGFLEKHTKCI